MDVEAIDEPFIFASDIDIRDRHCDENTERAGIRSFISFHGVMWPILAVEIGTCPS